MGVTSRYGYDPSWNVTSATMGKNDNTYCEGMITVTC